MRLEIEIPKEFEEHFKEDKFEDSLYRLISDVHMLAGNYEKETAIMLINAFETSKPAYNVDKVIAELEEERNDCRNWSDTDDYYLGMRQGLQFAIEIVRKGGPE